MTTTDKFETFHAENPRVYRGAVPPGPRVSSLHREPHKIGLRMLWERLRWLSAVTTDTKDRFKLNDHYTTSCARLMMDQEPDLAGVFTLRSRNDISYSFGRCMV